MKRRDGPIDELCCGTCAGPPRALQPGACSGRAAPHDAATGDSRLIRTGSFRGVGGEPRQSFAGETK
jgi:hypothetical protein